MASLDRELTAGRVPSTTARWSEYTKLSRQIKQAGLLDRRRGYYAAKTVLNLGLLAAGGAAATTATPTTRTWTPTSTSRPWRSPPDRPATSGA
jgi:hypothetical protein